MSMKFAVKGQLQRSDISPDTIVLILHLHQFDLQLLGRL
jgi:hypothetical protein